MKINRVIISIGGNIKNPLGFDPIITGEKAISCLQNHGLEILTKSNWYISDSVPFRKVPKFLNCLGTGQLM